MISTEMEPIATAPILLQAFRNGQAEFAMAATRYAESRPSPAFDTASEECLELLDFLVDCLVEKREPVSPGMEEACIYLLEHLASRFQDGRHGTRVRKERDNVIQ